MKRLWKQAKAEWEMTLCCLALAAVLISLLVGWGRLRSDTPDRVGRKQAPRQASLLAPDAIAFLGPQSGPGEELPSPFVFEGQTKTPKTTPSSRPRPKPDPPPETAPPRPPPRTAPPEPQPEPQPTPVVRQMVYGVRQIAYLYNARGDSGRPLAAIQVHDPVTNRTAPPAMLPIGGATEGIRIVNFDEEKLVVLDARGKRHQIPFGKSARVSSAPQLVEVRQ
ncbi:MAG: hypothetical protein RBU25_14765 [Lentisphaeria bacterium]|jgi:hypothetical protein|nr:hypothetical protein [Lentisphaeria bacterium]